jgi:hypothetical protein
MTALERSGFTTFHFKFNLFIIYDNKKNKKKINENHLLVENSFESQIFHLRSKHEKKLNEKIC